MFYIGHTVSYIPLFHDRIIGFSLNKDDYIKNVLKIDYKTGELTGRPSKELISFPIQINSFINAVEKYSIDLIVEFKSK